MEEASLHSGSRSCEMSGYSFRIYGVYGLVRGLLGTRQGLNLLPRLRPLPKVTTAGISALVEMGLHRTSTSAPRAAQNQPAPLHETSPHSAEAAEAIAFACFRLSTPKRRYGFPGSPVLDLGSPGTRVRFCAGRPEFWTEPHCKQARRVRKRQVWD